jgi:hypothetical protein
MSTSDISTIQRLLSALEGYPAKPPATMEQQWMEDPAGLEYLAAAETILLTDYGGTTPADTAQTIAEDAPHLYAEYGAERVLRVCEEIQRAEIPEQSELYQRMFQRFNLLYFDGRLPDYRIRVVYDVLYWKTNRCGDPGSEETGFVDSAGRQIFIRFLAFHLGGYSMAEWLIHEMALVATNGPGPKWGREMERLQKAGAPIKPDNLMIPVNVNFEMKAEIQ